MKKENIEEILKKLGTEDLPADVLEIAEQTSKDFEEILTQSKQPKRYVLGDYIMKSKLIKIAAAAVIIIAAGLGVYHFGSTFVGGTVTFADVIKPIFNARTATLTIIIGEEGSGVEIHDMIMESRIRRTLSNMEGVVAIIDMDSGRILQLTLDKKEAIYIDLKDWLAMPNYMESLQNVITRLQESPGFKVEELGIQQIDGRDLIGFYAEHPKTSITIWADPETALPVRIDQTEGQMNVICKDLQFDVPMDEELFNMDVPEGYSVQQTELDLTGATEEDFVEGLRIMAEMFGDGYFPESVSVEEYLKQAPAMAQKCEEMGLSKEQEDELGMKLSNYLLFIRFFKGEGKWHYAGNGVKLGDADTAIFWYRPEGSETYRVIYGDLTVKDVAPENLPQ